MASRDESITPTLLSIPENVINDIVALVDVQGRKALSLTHSKFLVACQGRLFRSLTFILDFDSTCDRDPRPYFFQSLPVLGQSPHLAKHVHSLLIKAKIRTWDEKEEIGKWKIDDFNRYVVGIKNLRKLEVMQLTRKRFLLCQRLTDALRLLILSNPDLATLVLGDTVYFPTEILPCISKLISQSANTGLIST